MTFEGDHQIGKVLGRCIADHHMDIGKRSEGFYPIEIHCLRNRWRGRKGQV